MKRKRKIILLGFAVILLVIIYFCIIKMYKKDYTIDYIIDDFKVKESYIETFKYYYLSVNLDKKNYDILIPHNKVKKKKIVEKIEVTHNEEYSCMLFKSSLIETYPICYKDDNRIDYSLIKEKIDFDFKCKKVNSFSKKYGNINLYTLPTSLAIWTHRGYQFISKLNSHDIKLFKEDTYYDKSSFQIDEYILIPDYDSEYAFSKIYLLDMKTGKVDNWELDREISFNFYFLGVIEGKGYIVDRKAKCEYELNPKKKTLKLVSNNNGMGKVWQDTWKEVSMIKLVSKDYTFETVSPISYVIKDECLYLEYIKNKTNILISNNSVNKIVYACQDYVYYLTKDKLYYFSPYTGEVLVSKYSEWEFNEFNTIYTY